MLHRSGQRWRERERRCARKPGPRGERAPPVRPAKTPTGDLDRTSSRIEAIEKALALAACCASRGAKQMIHAERRGRHSAYRADGSWELENHA